MYAEIKNSNKGTMVENSNDLIAFKKIPLDIYSVLLCFSHTSSKVQKLPSQFRFSLPSIIITIVKVEPWNTQNGPKSTNHKSQVNHDLLNPLK